MNSDIISFSSLAPIFPELILTIGAFAILMAGVFMKKQVSASLVGVAIGLLVAVAALILVFPSDGVILNGGFIQDSFARYMKVLVLAGSAFALVLSLSSANENALDKFEYPVLILFATIGMMIMISANDLMSLYIGLEMQALSLYIIAAMKRESSKASEAGLKYFVLGALSSGMLLYGASLVYGFTGQTQLDEIAKIIALGDRSIGLVFGLVFLLAGLSFKISAVPFHMWTPDVYEGAPTPVTAFFASAPKIAALALLIRVVTQGFEPISSDWQQVIIFLSIASMVLAAFAGIGQKNLKRLIAYSSIGHIGFALVGLSAGSLVGVQGVAIYMAIYLTMTLGLFAAILSLKYDNIYVEDVSDLAGLAQTRPFVAAMIAVFMFSLIGLPPLAGFFAKWHVFLAAIEAQLFVLAVIGVLASAIGAFYYLRVIKTMYFDEPVHQFAPIPGELRFIMGIAGFLIITYYLTVGAPLANIARSAVSSLF
ncbi:MAG: NADH-quinone oxidoreductase subunit NuoN [Devosiaceae bacterium]|nr:NADH-quinone oxidoreductase subunit NuoN [Devosiaceae bacterium]